ncbi:glycosyltransferase [Pseudomonas syringae]|nr:glycosyltransferase [Pseudomonas syringae]
MNPLPLVSIVIPAYNPRFFQAALQSALSQSYGNLEVVVSDDCRSQEVKRIIDEFSVPESVVLRYHRNSTRLGFVKNLLQAVEMARGEFVKVLCDDDRLFMESVTLQVQVMRAHADVSLVLNQRFLSDANNYVLPGRLANAPLQGVDTLFKGGDILALLEAASVNFLGNFSSALMRTSDVQTLLPALVQEGEGFCALLDFALFVCLLRRGNMVMLRSVLSIERLYPERLSKLPEMIKAAATETVWLKEMLAVRGGEGAPAAGWVRTVKLDDVKSGRPHEWQEIGLQRSLSNLLNATQNKVGGSSESYDEFYRDWLRARCFSQTELRLMPELIAAWPVQPRIGIIISDPYADEQAMQITLRSLKKQVYAPQLTAVLSNLELNDESVNKFPFYADWPGQLNQVMGVLPAVDWWYFLQAGDQLFDSAVLVLAERIANRSGIACVYSDECTLVDDQFVEPVFKPDFNLDLMRSYPYVGRALAFSNDSLKEYLFESRLGDLALHDVLWRLVETQGPQVVDHIHEVQLASLFGFAQWLSLPEMIECNRRLLSAHLDRVGIAYSIRSGVLPLINRVDYVSEDNPLVSVVIDAGDDLTALQRCVETLIEVTVGVRYEVVLVGSRYCSPEIAEWLGVMKQLDSQMLRVLGCEGHPVNGASLKNYAAQYSSGEYLLFLSADAVLMSPDWMTELLNHARRPEVGAVGARILDAKGSIRNVGLIMGLNGIASSPFIGEAADARGYMQRLLVNQNWSAVSSDCLMVRRDVFEGVEGFGVKQFELSLYDADLCLRIGKQGYLVVGTPYSSIVLTRAPVFKNDSRMLTRLETERESFYQHWISKVVWDPAYNPNLSLGASSFSLNAVAKGSWSPFCARFLPSVMVLPINSSAVGHYRVIQPLIELKAAGRVVGKCVYDSPSIVNVLRMDPDVIVLQCRYTSDSSAYIETLKKYSHALRVFELDDYVIEAPKKNTHARNKAADIAQTLAQSIALCDRVVVTTQALKNALSNMHDDIRVVPNMLAPHLWSDLKSRRRTSNRPRVGWGGGTSHSGDLEIIVDVVRELANEVEWVFFGMCPDELRPYIHEFHATVGLQAYPAKLASLNLDLALAPLEFHIFNDCKSNLRLLEYGACGYPVICTDTEAYRGFLPCTRIKTNSTAEWLEAIRSHLADPETSYRMGDQLREAVLHNFMLVGDNLKHWEWGWLPD